jgi:hypothetical protein
MMLKSCSVAVLCIEVAKGAKEGPVSSALMVISGLLMRQPSSADMPAKALKVHSEARRVTNILQSAKPEGAMYNPSVLGQRMK